MKRLTLDLETYLVLSQTEANLIMDLDVLEISDSLLNHYKFIGTPLLLLQFYLIKYVLGITQRISQEI